MRVLVVEDDRSIAEFIALGLSYESAEVIVAHDGHEALRLHRREVPDIVVLDIMLPKLDGLTVLQRLREQRDTPVILLTAKDELEDRVRGLEAGADDYLTKPFQFQELVARIRAVLRRHGSAPDEVVAVEDLRIDLRAHVVTRGSRVLELTAMQYDLLSLLASNAGRVLSKDQIFRAVWGWDLPNPNAVEQQVSRVRQLVDRPDDEPLIHTVRGVGYVLRREER